MPFSAIIAAYKSELQIIESTGLTMQKQHKRAGSCTEYALRENQFCEISDIRNHPEISEDKDLMNNFEIRFFAAYPLIDPQGNSIGSLNIYDNKPRVLTDRQKYFIAKGAKRIVTIFIEKRQEQRLLYFDNMFMMSNDIIGIMRLNGEIVKMNPAFFELMGHVPIKTKKCNLLDFIDPLFLKEAKDSIDRLSNGIVEKNYVLPLISKDNKVKWIEWTSTPETSTGLVYFIGRDITADFENTKMLENSEMRFRAFFENSQSLMCTHDLQGNFISINRSGADMIGCSVEEALKMNLRDFYPKEEQAFLLKTIAELVEKRTLSVISEAIRPDGEKRLWVINSIIQTNTDGEDYVIGNVVDVTEQLKIQEDLKIATKKAEEANRAKSEFIANMSHEIRTPLNGIIGFTDLVLKTKLDDAQEQYLKIINQSGATLLGIVDQILDFSKIESRKLTLIKEKIDLQSLASDACTMVSFASEKKGLEMLLDFQEDLPRFIWADEIRLKQVLVNLLSNAVKFTDKGEVKLSIQLLKKLPGNHLVLHFRVCDTGVGIHPDKLDQIFRAFAQEDGSITKKYGGTGLGLTISNKLLELMDSKLMVKSELEKGSCFSFELKLKAEKEKFDDELLKDVKRVLVVDDNDSNRQILKRMLELKNIQVDEANSGFAALQMLQKFAAYDVIIMDYHMPEMDGLETIRKIKGEIIHTKSAHEQPIVMLYSSSDSDKLQDKCDKLGVQSRLVKPIKMQEMYEVLAQLKNENLKKRSNKQEIPEEDKPSSLIETPLTILIAEDNEVNMYLAKILVGQLAPNSLVVEARDGEAAVDMFLDKQPDFVLMDIQMPQLNGFEATKQIRAKEKGTPIPIVALTAGTTEGEKERCLEAGMNDYMAKPIVKKDLAILLKKWLKPNERSKNEEAYALKKIEHLNNEWFEQIATNDVEFKTQFVELAKIGIEESTRALQKGILENDLKALQATGHKLKGTSLAVGLTELSKLAIAFELLTDFDEEYVNNLFESVLFEVRIVKKLLTNE